MITMDAKGVSWFGNMCQRFEAICVEVDETICEDTVKYVGNQMRTVGDNVKKFYSEVMQDLLASSLLDSVKEEDATVTESHHSDFAVSQKPKLDKENALVNAETEQMIKDSDSAAAAASNNAVNHASCCSAEEQFTSENSQSDKFLSSNRATCEENVLRSMQDSEPKSLSDMSSINAFVIKKSADKFTGSEVCYERDEPIREYWDVSSKEASDMEVSNSEEDEDEISGDEGQGHESVYLKGSETRLSSSGHASAELDVPVSSTNATEDATVAKGWSAVGVQNGFPVSDTETSNPLLADEIQTVDADKQGTLHNEVLSKLKLEESCVIVEKSDHSTKLTLEDVQKSYKKKIKEVFSARRWSKNKRDQEQLAVWYEEQCGKKLVSIPTIHAQNSQTFDSFESEWELV